MAAVIHFARSWVERFIDVQGVDRAMALAGQAFSALIPLLIVYSAIVSRGEGASFAARVVERFDLSGAAAESVRQAFTSSETVEDSVSLFGLLLVIIAALSFTRAMQRLYEGAYGLPALGVRNTRWGLTWLALIVLYTTVRPFAAGLFDGALAHMIVSLSLASALWIFTPYLLLGKRMHWKPLLPGAVLAAAGMAALGATSAIWLPRTISTSAEQFGVMGVAFALLSWLVAWGFVVVIAATGGAILSERLKEWRLRRPAPVTPPPRPRRGPRYDR